MAELAAQAPPPNPSVADNDGEWFDLVDEGDRVVGKELRRVCHERGLLHRAVYCWVFNRACDLLIQRRSDQKKIGPGQWDLSVAEHLQPGESYRQGVVRGLQEELGIAVEEEAVEGPLAATHKRELHQGAFHDVELVQSFRLAGFEGSLRLDPGEVSEAKFVPLGELRRHAAEDPEQYTQWLREEADSLNWFGAE